jgi:hypothetical protein
MVTAAATRTSFSPSPDGTWLAIWDSDADRLVRLLANGRGTTVPIVLEVSQHAGPGGPAVSSW